MSSRPLVLDHILNFMKMLQGSHIPNKIPWPIWPGQRADYFKVLENVLCIGICRKPE